MRNIWLMGFCNAVEEVDSRRALGWRTYEGRRRREKKANVVRIGGKKEESE